MGWITTGEKLPPTESAVGEDNMAFCTKLTKRAFSTTAGREAIKNVTIIGGGLMGAGIAQVIHGKEIFLRCFNALQNSGCSKFCSTKIRCTSKAIRCHT